MSTPKPDKTDEAADAPESARHSSPSAAEEPEAPADEPEAPADEPEAPAKAARAPLAAKSGAARGAAADAPRGPLTELGTGAAWLVGLAAVGQMVAVLFRTNMLAIAVLQAVIVDLALGRAGVRWEPAADEKDGSDYRKAARGIAMGAGVALAVTVVVVGVGAALGRAKVAVHGPTTSLVLGLVRSVAIGVRDALLYAGLPLYFVGRARMPRTAGVVFGALASGAVLALRPGAEPANVALAVAVGAAAAAFWARDGAGWGAAGIAGGFAFFAGVVLRGGLIDVDWKTGALAPGLSASGAPAWMATAAFLAVAVWALRIAPRRAQMYSNDEQGGKGPAERRD